MLTSLTHFRPVNVCKNAIKLAQKRPIFFFSVHIFVLQLLLCLTRTYCKGMYWSSKATMIKINVNKTSGQTWAQLLQIWLFVHVRVKIHCMCDQAFHMQELNSSPLDHTLQSCFLRFAFPPKLICQFIPWTGGSSPFTVSQGTNVCHWWKVTFLFKMTKKN